MSPTAGLTLAWLFYRPKDNEWVFASFGKWINTAGLIRQDLETAKISLGDKGGNEICLHSLRNSYISFLANSETPAKVIQKLARHSDPRLTFNVYAKTFDEAEQKALDYLPDFGGFCLGHLLGQNVRKTADFGGLPRNKNGQDVFENAVLTTNQIAPRGFEPLNENSEPPKSKELTENQNPVLSTSLDKILQDHPELRQIINVWPNLPGHIKMAIITLMGRS